LIRSGALNRIALCDDALRWHFEALRWHNSVIWFERRLC